MDQEYRNCIGVIPRYNSGLGLAAGLMILSLLLGCAVAESGGILCEVADESGSIVEKYEVLTLDNGRQVKHGSFWSYRDGYEERGAYRYGDKHGAWETLSDTGEVVVGHFVEDRLDGKFIMWDSNGQKRLEANYQLGKLHGARRSWDAQGNLVAIEVFVNGHRVE